MHKSAGILKYLLPLLLIADLAFSFVQHYHMPLGGDIAQVVLPSPGKGYYDVLQDPLGLSALVHQKEYPNPNKYFAHISASLYFKKIPLMFQLGATPVDSIYLSAATIKTLVQLLLIVILAIYISGNRNITSLDFLISAVLVFPFFQTFGFNSQIGIIDKSAIYTFFYAFPCGLLMLYFLPFHNHIYNRKPLKLKLLVHFLLIISTLFLTLSGPLNPGVILIVCLLVVVDLVTRNFRKTEPGHSFRKLWLSFKRIPFTIRFYLVLISLLSLYSLYLGRYNSLDESASIPFTEAYARLGKGLVYLLTEKIAFPLLLVAIAINLVIIRMGFNEAQGSKTLKLAGWISVFAVLYLLLLPYGGYRLYRPHIIRHDTLLPVTIGLVYIFGLSSLFLIKNITGRRKIVYLAGVICILLIYTISDKLEPGEFQCEKGAIEVIASSSQSVVGLEVDCPVMDWRRIGEPSESDLKAGLLMYWNVTDEKKLFYHK